jgi:hypothetical protein
VAPVGQCGKEKDSKFKAPRMSLPKMFLKGEMTSADRVIVILLHFFLWAFAVSSIWVVLGGSIIKCVLFFVCLNVRVYALDVSWFGVVRHI